MGSGKPYHGTIVGQRGPVTSWSLDTSRDRDRWICKLKNEVFNVGWDGRADGSLAECLLFGPEFLWPLISGHTFLILNKHGLFTGKASLSSVWVWLPCCGWKRWDKPEGRERKLRLLGRKSFGPEGKEVDRPGSCLVAKNDSSLKILKMQVLKTSVRARGPHSVMIVVAHGTLPNVWTWRWHGGVFRTEVEFRRLQPPSTSYETEGSL